MSHQTDAPKLTAVAIENAVEAEQYFFPVPTKLTLCVLTLKNGFVVTGESACVSPANFVPDIGKSIARENAISKVWDLEAYLLQQRLHEAGSAS